MKISKKQPLYIAVQFANTDTDRRVWLDLPAMKTDFGNAIVKIGAESGNFKIVSYNRRVPGLPMYALMDAPLSVANHFASRLEKLSDAEILKLCAIGDSLYYFNTMWQFVNFTYCSDNYTLLRGICDEEALSIHYLGNPNTLMQGETHQQRVFRYEYGKSVAKLEHGAFTSLGYITSKDKWSLTRKAYAVPDSLNLRGYLGEDLYGDWNCCEW